MVDGLKLENAQERPWLPKLKILGSFHYIFLVFIKISLKLQVMF